MREAFARGDWRKTLNIYEKMAEIVKRRQSVRVEEFPKKVHCDFLARAFMDLRN
ncbi:hypothetical protein BH10PSE6_BH10PSE6_10350 [soil metagenome]